MLQKSRRDVAVDDPPRVVDGLQAYELDNKTFDQLRKLIYDISGIHLKDAKLQMVQSRLTSRLRTLGLPGFELYMEHLAAHPEELTHMLNRITTNKTYFFREPKHFDMLRGTVLPELVRRAVGGGLRTVNAWCAASSTGEEPYTLCMELSRFFAQHSGWSVRLLASDLDTNVLAAACAATYPRSALDGLPSGYASAYTDPAPGDADAFVIKPEVARLAQFRQINLMGERYPIRSALDFIFCRNVFIYFTREDRDKVVKRFIQLLKPGGYLFLGHSEVLDLKEFNDQLRFVGNTTYQRTR
ncbi:MAG: protein-glutamate O-methyltransferase CheR [Nitrospirae bacterium]|nr:protein-glutamate O-methyltransferase CheR [Nitrospirota bacterium]